MQTSPLFSAQGDSFRSRRFFDTLSRCVYRHVAYGRASGQKARRRGARRAASNARLVIPLLLGRRPAAVSFPSSTVASSLFFRCRAQLSWQRGQEEAFLTIPAEHCAVCNHSVFSDHLFFANSFLRTEAGNDVYFCTRSIS